MMRKRRRNIISRLAGMALCAVSAAVVLPSCESFFEYLDPCPHGVSLRFVYDYNMEYANAFPKKVDCLTVLVYDDEGAYVATHSVTGPELQDENYRMRLELDEGAYTFIAYGGMACEKSSFGFVAPPAEGRLADELEVVMKGDMKAPVRKKLHDLYWGSLTLETVDLTCDECAAETVEMMKNTNNIRVVLQQINGGSLKVSDFKFKIVDDNTRLSKDNEVLPNGTVTYEPWAKDETSPGVNEEGDDEVVVYAEFSTSRLTTGTSPQLIVTTYDESRTVVDIPLNNYLLLLKSEGLVNMSPQQFLDRESEWSLVFLLNENGAWLKTSIIINGWTVNLSNDEVEIN